MVRLTLQAQSEQFVYYDLSEAVSNEVIKSVIKDTQGYIWFATDEGIVRYNGVSREIYTEGLNSHYVKHYLNTHDGRLLVIDDLGISEIITVGDSVHLVPFNWGEYMDKENLSYPKSIYQDRSGNIWIGEVSSILRINQDGFKRFNLGNEYQSISYHRTFTFQEDAFGSLWVAPYKGKLLRYEASNDQLVEVDLELPITDVSGFSIVNGDYLMLGGKEGILQIKVDSDKQLLDTAFIQSVGNISALQSAGDQLFVGTWDQGLFKYKIKTKSFERIEAVTFNDIVDFYYDPNSPEVWVVGSENLGLLSFSVMNSFEPVGRYRVEAVATSDNQIFFSIGQELRSFTLGSNKPAMKLLQTKSNYFNKILAKEDVIWIGDSFGAILKYNVRKGNINLLKDSTGTAIKHAFMDNQSNKWFSGNQKHVVKVAAYTDEVKLYPIEASNVVKQSPNGNIYCGTSGIGDAFYQYEPQTDSFIKIPLSVQVEGSFSIEDMSFSSDGQVWIISNHGIYTGDPDSGAWSKVLLEGVSEEEQFKAVAIKDDIIWLAGNSGLRAYNGKETILFNTKNGLPSKLLNWRGLLPYQDGVLVSSAKGLVMVKSEMVKFEKTPAPLIQKIKTSVGGEQANDAGTMIVPYKGSIELEFVTLTYPGKQILYQSRIIGVSEEWSEPTSNRQLSFLGFSDGKYKLQVRSREIGALWSEPTSLEFVVPVPWYKTWWSFLIFSLLATLVIFAAIRAYNYNLILQKRRFKQIIEERTKQINEQKNEIIAHKNRIIEQKEELLSKSQAIHKSQQALSEADVNFLHLKEKQLLDQIEYKNKQISTHTLHIIQKNETLKDLKEKLEKLLKSPNKLPVAEIRKTIKIIDDSYRMDNDWEDFRLYFEQIYTGFYAKLKVNCHSLTSQELKHCALIRLNLSMNECASILGISPDSVKVSRSRIRKKLNMDAGQNLADFILSI